jgi:hypothetical protein
MRVTVRIDDSVPTAEGLSLTHSLQDGSDVISVVGMLMLQQKASIGNDGFRFVTMHPSHRFRPLPTLSVEEEPEPSDALGIALTDHPIHGTKPIAHIIAHAYAYLEKLRAPARSAGRRRSTNNAAILLPPVLYVGSPTYRTG